MASSRRSFSSVVTLQRMEPSYKHSCWTPSAATETAAGTTASGSPTPAPAAAHAVNGALNGVAHSGVNAFAKQRNGHHNGDVHSDVKGVANGWLDSDDEDDEFFGAEERSCCSDSEFHDANDASDSASDSEGSYSAAMPRISRQTIAARLQEEQARCAALETELALERSRVKELTLRSQGGAVEGSANLTCPLTSGDSMVQVNTSGPQEFEQSPPVGVEQCAEAEKTVARLVWEAVGRAAGRAEAEAQMAQVVEQKEKELGRLREKLQYWETMNQEMCQQNTEAIEMLRQRRRMWRTVVKVTYVGGAAVLGISLLVALSFATGSTRQHEASSTSSGEAHAGSPQQ